MKTGIMLAVAALVAGGVWAQCSDPVVANCSQVYDFKASLKTTKGKAYSGDCDDICYRAKGSRTYKGYIYSCECDCTNFVSGSTLYAYDKKTDTEIYGVPYWMFLNAVGKSGMEAEGLFVLSGYYQLLYGAGHGKFDDSGLLKSMSGNIVGYMEPPYCAQLCTDGEYAVAYPACYWEPVPTIPMPVYGSWSLKYNKKLSSKYSLGLWSPPVVLLNGNG